MNPPALELRKVNRRINSEFYLRDVSLTLERGRCAALIGRNASGKTSLMKLIGGVYPADSGQLLREGRQVAIASPQDAKNNGILFLEQNGQGFPGLDICGNLYFGHELFVRGTKVLDTRRMYQNCRQVFAQLGCYINPKGKLKDLTDGQRQMVRLASAVLSGAQVVLMDEPSTRLSPRERGRFYQAVERMKGEGVSFLLVSHDMDEVLALSDSIYVLRRGQICAALPTAQATLPWAAEQITGQPVQDLYHKLPLPRGAQLGELCLPGLERPLPFHAGEILALVGPADSGAEELLLAAAGCGEQPAAVCTLNGTPLCNPVDGLRAGAVLGCSAQWEQRLERYRRYSQKVGDSRAATRRADLRENLEMTGETLRCVLGGTRPGGEYYTGGNRQRELMERTLAQPGSLYLLCHPTSGVDLPSRMELYARLMDRAAQGSAVLLCTSHPDEAAGLADRVAVLRRGRVCQLLDAPVEAGRLRQTLREG